MSDSKIPWVPEIMYEEDETGFSSHIPFIQVPQEEEMPRLLFLFESRETGEFEPGAEGEELPVTELDLHQYANLSYLKEKMTLAEYDYLRICLGLEPLETAVEKGRDITENIRTKFEK